MTTRLKDLFLKWKLMKPIKNTEENSQKKMSAPRMLLISLLFMCLKKKNKKGTGILKILKMMTLLDFIAIEDLPSYRFLIKLLAKHLNRMLKFLEMEFNL
jgi:hypothetical protein